MRVGIGSRNITKINAVTETLRDYPMFKGAEIHEVDVNIDPFGHPKNIDETVAGAVDRAKQAYTNNDYGFGLESGLMAVPQTKSGFMEVTVCAVYDGQRAYIGLSPAFEWPPAVFENILSGMDGSQAMKAADLTDREKAGEHEGFPGIFTKGRMNRTEYNKCAIIMALIQLENSEHY